MRACRVSLEHQARRFTGNYTVRGREITVTSREHGQLSGTLGLLSPSQKALVLLLRMVLVAEAETLESATR